MKNLKIKLISFCLITLFSFSLFAAQVKAVSMFDQMSKSVKSYTNEAFGGGSEVAVDATTFSSGLISIINILLTFVGMVFFLMMIYAGFTWMSARGNEEQVTKSKTLIKEMVIGLIIIITARLITEFILTNIGNITK